MEIQTKNYDYSARFCANFSWVFHKSINIIEDEIGPLGTGSGPIGPNWPVSNILVCSQWIPKVYFLETPCSSQLMIKWCLCIWFPSEVYVKCLKWAFIFQFALGGLNYSWLTWLLLPIVQFREGLTNCSLVLEHDHKMILSSSPASKKAKTFQNFSRSCPHVLSKLSKCCLQVVKKLSSSCVQKQSMEFPSSVKWRRLECYDNLHQNFRDFDT